MKAITFKKYGTPDVFKIEDTKKPVPKDDEILIKIRASSVIAGDCEIRSFRFPVWWFWVPLRIYMGIFRPRIKILGQELAGEIEAVGKNVKRFKKGDKVFGPASMRFGAYAEYICLSTKNAIAKMPENMAFEQAATVPTGGLNALHFIRKANIRKGEKILINGAAGNIGSFAIQLAKYYGAEVIAVDSAEKLDVLLSLGADKVIDYRKEDFTKTGEKYDVIYDVVGKSSFSKSLKCLKPNGRYVLANPDFLSLIRANFHKQILVSAFAPYSSEDLEFLKELIENGCLKSYLDEIFPMDKIVEAHEYVETGQKIGNVAVSIP